MCSLPCRPSHMRCFWCPGLTLSPQHAVHDMTETEAARDTLVARAASRGLRVVGQGPRCRGICRDSQDHGRRGGCADVPAVHARTWMHVCRRWRAASCDAAELQRVTQAAVLWHHEVRCRDSRDMCRGAGVCAASRSGGLQSKSRGVACLPVAENTTGPQAVVPPAFRTSAYVFPCLRVPPVEWAPIFAIVRSRLLVVVWPFWPSGSAPLRWLGDPPALPRKRSKPEVLLVVQRPPSPTKCCHPSSRKT
jgi:hypothetical protein